MSKYITSSLSYKEPKVPQSLAPNPNKIPELLSSTIDK